MSDELRKVRRTLEAIWRLLLVAALVVLVAVVLVPAIRRSSDHRAHEQACIAYPGGPECPNGH